MSTVSGSCQCLYLASEITALHALRSEAQLSNTNESESIFAHLLFR